MTDLALPGRGAVIAWGFWDWAFSAFNAVATTFVFSTYLSGSAFGDPARESELLGLFMAVAGAGRHRVGRRLQHPGVPRGEGAAAGARDRGRAERVLRQLRLALLLPVKPGQDLSAPAAPAQDART